MTRWSRSPPRPHLIWFRRALEGDLDNARYWYRKAGRSFHGHEAVDEEIAAARSAAQ